MYSVSLLLYYIAFSYGFQKLDCDQTLFLKLFQVAKLPIMHHEIHRITCHMLFCKQSEIYQEWEQ